MSSDRRLVVISRGVRQKALGVGEGWSVQADTYDTNSNIGAGKLLKKFRPFQALVQNDAKGRRVVRGAAPINQNTNE